MIWRKLEIVIVFIALALFARHHYQQGEFLMLFVIYNRLTKESKNGND